MLHSAYRIVAFALQSFFRNIWLSLATLTVIVITLLLVNTIITIDYIKGASLNALEQQIDISLDFKPTISETDVRDIRNELLTDSRIARVDMVSDDENISRLAAKYPFLQDTVLPALERNPLGYSLKIIAKDFADYSDILTMLEQNEGYNELLLHRNLNDHRVFISKITVVIDRINKGVLAIASIFMIISLIIIFNTIKVSVYTHREEIAIMRLVGASNWFIQMPYIVEAFIYAVIAVVTVGGLIFGTIYLIEPLLGAFFGSVLTIDITSYFIQNALLIFGAQFVITLLVIIVSIFIGSRKYLRV